MRMRMTPRHDMLDATYLLKRIGKIKKFYADKGYDSEEIHKICYNFGIQTYIPIRKNVKLRRFRRIQMKNWDKSEYNKRSNIESGFSAIKRKYGSWVNSKKFEGQRCEIICKGIVHNLNLY